MRVLELLSRKINELFDGDEDEQPQADARDWEVQFKDSDGKVQTQKMKGKDVAEIKNMFATKHKDCKFISAKASTPGKDEDE